MTTKREKFCNLNREYIDCILSVLFQRVYPIGISCFDRLLRHLPEIDDNISQGSMIIFMLACAKMQGPKLRPPTR